MVRSLHEPNLPSGRAAEGIFRHHAVAERYPQVPTKTAKVALPAKVNHGRWIVECPCGGAQLASKTDRRFFCIDCGNVLFEGEWVHVDWPKNVEAIEQALSRRPFAANQNWEPGESLEDLQGQTAEGLGVLAKLTGKLKKVEK